MAAILFPVLQFTDDNSNPVASGQLETYVAGTSTGNPTYTNSTGDTQANAGGSGAGALILDSDGRANSGNGLWLGTTSLYKLVLKDSVANGGATIWQLDNVSSGGFNGSSSFITATAESGLTSARVLTAGSDVALTDAGAGSTMTVAGKHPINSQTGTTYTIVAGDRGKVVKFSTQASCTVTMTAAATLGDGWYCYVVNNNSAALTITGVGLIPFSGGSALLTCNGSTFDVFLCPRITTNTISFRTGSSAAVANVSVDTLQSNEYILANTHYTVTQTNPAQITSSQNNYVVTSQVNILTADGAYNITGLTMPSVLFTTGSAIVYLVNSSAFTLTLKNQDAASTAANRFKFSTGADIALTADQTIALIYDNTADRWRNIPV